MDEMVDTTSLAEFSRGALKVFREHGNGKIDIAMSGTINHALTNDLCAAWPKFLSALTELVSDI